MADKLHKDLIGNDLHFARSKDGAGSPNGVVTALVSGEIYFDIQSCLFYVSTAAGNSNWKPANGFNGYRQVTCPAGAAQYDLVRITGNDTVDKAGKEIALGTADAVIVTKISATVAIVATGSFSVAGLGSLSLTGGDRIYLGDSTATPNYAKLADISVGEIQQEVGKMWNATEANVNIDQSEIIL